MQPVAFENHFQLFGIAPGFNIDVNALAERYRELQRAVHPDKFAHATAQDRRLAMQHAANINEAFRVLKDPVQRALYLLRMNGVNVPEHSNTPLDAAFLMQQMELRETIDDARASASRAAAVARLQAEIDAWERELLDELGRAFATATPAALQQAVVLAQKLRFFKRVREDVLALEDVDD